MYGLEYFRCVCHELLSTFSPILLPYGWAFTGFRIMVHHYFYSSWLVSVSQYHDGKCSPHKNLENSKPQQVKSNRNPPEESLGMSNPKEDPSWRKKEVITRCQRENFASMKFEIQIWVWNFGRRVEYSKIWRNGFPFAQLTFILSWRSGQQTDVSTI